MAKYQKIARFQPYMVIFWSTETVALKCYILYRGGTEFMGGEVIQNPAKIFFSKNMDTYHEISNEIAEKVSERINLDPP